MDRSQISYCSVCGKVPKLIKDSDDYWYAICKSESCPDTEIWDKSQLEVIVQGQRAGATDFHFVTSAIPGSAGPSCWAALSSFVIGTQ